MPDADDVDVDALRSGMPESSQAAEKALLVVRHASS
jgi:hypothetical protein